MVRRNIRVRSSQRTTLAHWLMRIGRSRYDCTQRANVAPMIVSLVGRTMSGSSSLADGAGRSAGLCRIGLQPMVRDDRALLGEALDVLGLLLQEAHRDEQREVRVLVAGGLEHRVEPPLDVLPDGVAPRLDDHAAADVGVLGQVGGLDHLLVPLGVVFFAGRRDGGLGGHGRTVGCRPEAGGRRAASRERHDSPASAQSEPAILNEPLRTAKSRRVAACEATLILVGCCLLRSVAGDATA